MPKHPLTLILGLPLLGTLLSTGDPSKQSSAQGSPEITRQALASEPLFHHQSRAFVRDQALTHWKAALDTILETHSDPVQIWLEVKKLLNQLFGRANYSAPTPKPLPTLERDEYSMFWDYVGQRLNASNVLSAIGSPGPLMAGLVDRFLSVENFERTDEGLRLLLSHQTRDRLLYNLTVGLQIARHIRAIQMHKEEEQVYLDNNVLIRCVRESIPLMLTLSEDEWNSPAPQMTQTDESGTSMGDLLLWNLASMTDPRLFYDSKDFHPMIIRARMTYALRQMLTRLEEVRPDGSKTGAIIPRKQVVDLLLKSLKNQKPNLVDPSKGVELGIGKMEARLENLLWKPTRAFRDTVFNVARADWVAVNPYSGMNPAIELLRDPGDMLVDILTDMDWWDPIQGTSVEETLESELRDFLLLLNPILHFVLGTHESEKQVSYPHVCFPSSNIAMSLIKQVFGNRVTVELMNGKRLTGNHTWLEIKFGQKRFFLSFTEGQFHYAMPDGRDLPPKPTKDRVGIYQELGFGRGTFLPIESKDFFAIRKLTPPQVAWHAGPFQVTLLKIVETFLKNPITMPTAFAISASFTDFLDVESHNVPFYSPDGSGLYLFGHAFLYRSA